MSISQGRLDKFIRGELEIHFQRIEIVQNAVANPLRYCGPGTVSVKEGRLEYILHHALVDQENDRALLSGLYGEAGQVITADQSFHFSGVDVNGTSWFASETDNQWGVLGQNGAVVKGYLQCLRTEKKAAPIHEHYINYLIVSNGAFPRVGFVPEGGINFIVEGKDVCASFDEYGCELAISGVGTNDVCASAVLKIFEIISGSILQVRAVEYHYSGTCWIELRSVREDMQNVQLPPPIKLSSNAPWVTLEEFFSGFYKFFLKDGEKLYDYWYQLNRAWQGGLQAASLTICIYIEGVLREYFKALGQDPGFHEMAKASLSEVSKLVIDGRVIEMLKSSIGNAGQFKAKTALHKLEEDQAVSEGLAGKWTRLRNNSAHGVRAEEGYAAQQRQVDLTFNNLKLFYEIAFHLGGYEGSRIDYGIHGFPEKSGRSA